MLSIKPELSQFNILVWKFPHPDIRSLESGFSFIPVVVTSQGLFDVYYMRPWDFCCTTNNQRKYKNNKLWLYFLSKLAVHGQTNLQCGLGFITIVIAQSWRPCSKMRRNLRALTEGFVSSETLLDVHTVLSSQRVEDWAHGLLFGRRLLVLRPEHTAQDSPRLSRSPVGGQGQVIWMKATSHLLQLSSSIRGEKAST